MSEHTTDIYTGTDEHTGEQYLMRVYRDTHGITRTIARRDHAGATWGAEHILFAEPAAS